MLYQAIWVIHERKFWEFTPWFFDLQVDGLEPRADDLVFNVDHCMTEGKLLLI